MLPLHILNAYAVHLAYLFTLFHPGMPQSKAGCVQSFKPGVKLIMKNLIHVAAACSLLGLFVSNVGAQPLPGAHPAYLHALSALRAARWFLNHQAGDARVYASEDAGIHEIDAAIGEVKRASIDDGKDLNDHPNVDVREHGSRLLKAIEALKKAHADVNQTEDDPQLRGLKHRILDHIDHALHAAEDAHAEWLRDAKG
jgi:hypothetical protein